MLWFVNLWRLYASWITSATSRWQPKGFWHYCWHGNWKCKKNGWANGWPSSRCEHFIFLWWESFLRSLLVWCWSSGIMSFILVSMMFSALFSLDICHHSSIHIHIWQSVGFGTFLYHSLFVFYSQWWCCISFFTRLIIVIRRGETYITAPSFIKSYLKHHGPWSLHDLNASSWKGISLGRLLIWMATTAVTLHPLLLYG